MLVFITSLYIQIVSKIRKKRLAKEAGIDRINKYQLQKKTCVSCTQT